MFASCEHVKVSNCKIIFTTLVVYVDSNMFATCEHVAKREVDMNMEHDNAKTEKPTKIERLQQSIEEIEIKINKLLIKKEELKIELENTQKNEILSIITSQYKTPEEVTAFIKQAKNGGFILDLVRQERKENKKETEVKNEILANNTSEIRNSH